MCYYNMIGTSCFLQRIYPKFWTTRIMECDHVFDIGAGNPIQNIFMCTKQYYADIVRA